MAKEDIVVVAVDGSDASKNAVRWAANTAMKREIPLRIASSYTIPQFLYAEGMVPPKDLYDDLQDDTLEKIEEARAIAHEVAPELKIGHTIAEGSPIDMLLEMSQDVTMVVMGSRGMGGLSGMVMGSVSAAVVSHAACPVVVVREDNNVTDSTKYGPVVVGVDGSEVSQKDDMIVSLYAGGMTIRDIQHHMATAMRVDISHETISAVTDAVGDEVMVWQNRQLDEFYPVIFLDALRIKVRDGGRVVNKSAYMAIGVDLDGIKHILGLWIAKEEGASFWAHVCANLANRGVKDVFIVCCDGLKGLPEAVEATWPNSMVQTCIVHLIRAANRWVAYGDRRAVSAALKKVYTATDESTAEAALKEFFRV